MLTIHFLNVQVFPYNQKIAPQFSPNPINPQYANGQQSGEDPCLPCKWSGCNKVVDFLDLSQLHKPLPLLHQNLLQLAEAKLSLGRMNYPKLEDNNLGLELVDGLVVEGDKFVAVEDGTLFANAGMGVEFVGIGTRHEVDKIVGLKFGVRDAA